MAGICPDSLFRMGRCLLSYSSSFLCKKTRNGVNTNMVLIQICNMDIETCMGDVKLPRAQKSK